MMTLRACLAIFLVWEVAESSLATTYGTPTEAGVSDEYLLRVGSRTAVDLLIRRLEDKGNEKYHDGIIQRIDWFLELSPNVDAVDAFDRFIQRSLIETDRTGRVMETACRTLHKLGAHGETRGEEILAKYLGDGSPLQKTRNPGFEGRTPRDTIDRLLGCAIRGLGLTGTRSSEELLRNLQRNTPAFWGAANRQLDFEGALSDLLRVRAVGIGSVYGDFSPNPFRQGGNR